MTTTRLVALLLAVGALVLFAVQNTSPALPLVFLGMQTRALPIAVWLVGAIAAGAITALLLAGLIELAGSNSRSEPRSNWTQPQGDRPSAARWQTPPARSDRSQAASPPPKTASRDRSPQEADWETFRSPENWDNWGEQPDPDAPPPRQPPRSRRQREQYQVEDSLNELTQGWEDWQAESPATGASVAADLRDTDDLEAGWEDWPDDMAVEDSSPRDYEAPASPKRVYQSGSIYAESYRGDDEAANVRPDGSAAGETAIGGRVGEDGVYEADYRVIIPPYRNLDETDDADWPTGDRPSAP